MTPIAKPAAAPPEIVEPPESTTAAPAVDGEGVVEGKGVLEGSPLGSVGITITSGEELCEELGELLGLLEGVGTVQGINVITLLQIEHDSMPLPPLSPTEANPTDTLYFSIVTENG